MEWDLVVYGCAIVSPTMWVQWVKQKGREIEAVTYKLLQRQAPTADTEPEQSAQRHSSHVLNDKVTTGLLTALCAHLMAAVMTYCWDEDLTILYWADNSNYWHEKRHNTGNASQYWKEVRNVSVELYPYPQLADWVVDQWEDSQRCHCDDDDLRELNKICSEKKCIFFTNVDEQCCADK